MLMEEEDQVRDHLSRLDTLKSTRPNRTCAEGASQCHCKATAYQLWEVTASGYTHHQKGQERGFVKL